MLLWAVSLRKKETGERINLYIEAETCDSATYKVTDLGLIGYDAKYEWIGSGPVYDSEGNRIRL